MQKLFNADILDIFIVPTGFIYACKENSKSGEDIVSFFEYSTKKDEFKRIPVNKYISEKYGESGFAFAKQLGDFVTCNIHTVTDDTNIAAYDNGTVIVFDNEGIISKTLKVTYKNHPAVSPEPNGRDLWMAVPEANAIINYSLKYGRIEFRIGSAKEKTFSHPTGISIYDNYLYVCNASSFKIRTVGLESYSVKDYRIFNEPVYKYIRTEKSEYVMLDSGFYEL